MERSEEYRTGSFNFVRVAAMALACSLILLAAPAAEAQKFNVLYNFTGGLDGANPHVGMTLDRAGNLYGTAYSGGAGYGTAYKLSHLGAGWVMTPLYSFKGKPADDGAGPDSKLVVGPNGSLF